MSTFPPEKSVFQEKMHAYAFPHLSALLWTWPQTQERDQWGDDCAATWKTLVHVKIVTCCQLNTFCQDVCVCALACVCDSSTRFSLRCIDSSERRWRARHVSQKRQETGSHHSSPLTTRFFSPSFLLLLLLLLTHVAPLLRWRRKCLRQMSAASCLKPSTRAAELGKL